METSPSVVSSLLSGTVAGCAATFVGQPFDSVKVVQQVNKGKSAVAVVMQGVRERSLYRGTTPALASAVTENGVVFAMNSILKRIYNPRGDQLSLAETASIGGVAGIFSATAITPLETLKVRLQACASAYRSPWDCLRSTLREEGARSLFKGLPAQIARDVPFNFAFFGSYETISRSVARLRGVPKQDLSVPEQLVSGGLAGVSSWIVTLPMDVVKTKVQAMRHDRHEGNATLRAIRDVHREAGVRGFFRGLGAVSVRAFLVNGVLFTSYETCLSLF